MENFITENYDKWLHFLVMGMLSVWMVGLAKTKSKKWVAFSLCVLIAASKEVVFDFWLGKGNAELMDFLFSMIMPLIGLIVSLILRRK